MAECCLPMAMSQGMTLTIVWSCTLTDPPVGVSNVMCLAERSEAFLAILSLWPPDNHTFLFIFVHWHIARIMGPTRQRGQDPAPWGTQFRHNEHRPGTFTRS